ncbi:hypothetical protein HF086_013032 [Spodoptera exigua]|uniref:Cytochrome b561 domain-containing protein n=1 Tax=Spodoptera exigua TaxID=7107 RepID=A0A922MR94_SPOEX|nr:hypothetical protein HF086_013032 [Spodoptera exigua]
MSSPPKVSFYVGCMNAINTLAHVLMGGALFLTISLIDGESIARLKGHACTTIIGVTILCSQAILSVNPYAGFEDNFMYPRKSKVYWIIQIIGSLLVVAGACVGVALVFETSNITLPFPIPVTINTRHLQTSHAIVGFLVLLLGSVSLVGAIANLLLGEKIKSFMKTLYVVVGTITIIMAYIAICIKFGDYNKAMSTFGLSNATIPLGITFAVLSFVALLVMMCARVIMTGSIRF